jgi:Galactocerebrosidase, C-terminal lectin domain
VVVDFENMAAGAAPDGFTTGLTGEGKPVQWIVVEDDSAPSGARALAETSGDATSYRFPLAIYDGLVAKDVYVSVRFKPISGEVDQAAGLVVRVLDTDNYYIARANALEDNVRLYKVVDGDRKQFAGADTAVEQGQWQTLGLSAEGNRFEVSLNGDVLFSATDDTFSEEGRVGLWTKADSLTHFDDLAIRRIQ